MALRSAITDGIVGRSPALRDALDRMQRVAATDVTVLILGETGTGKELVARAIHHRSRRATRAMMTVNLAAIPDSLMASELFGHEAGAFTGAMQRRIGRIESADRSTLFLDEVGELTPDMQIALLRVLQERAFERLGSSQTREVDVRFVAATNRNLEDAIAAGRFRADLYYRIGVFPLRLPALRQRPEDIPMLAEFFLDAVSRRIGRSFSGINSDSLDRLAAFSWPGNIRQLQNVVEHSAILCDGPVLDVPSSILVEPSTVGARTSILAVTMADGERRIIEDALRQSAGRVSGPEGAAVRLGMPGSTLESKIKRLGIDKFQARRPSA
jgi:transcriptional regulator with GAF, ATPase, and Fis domain